MKIEIKKQVTETIQVDIDLPSYHLDYGVVYKITQDGIIVVAKESIHKSQLHNIETVLKYTKITAEEFSAAFNNAVNNLSALISNTVSELEVQEG